MRRMIKQKSFINEQQVAVEPLAEGIKISDYKIEQIGNMVFGYIKFVCEGDSQPANTKLIKISGLPEMACRATCMQAHEEGTGGATACAMQNSDDGLWVIGAATKDQDLSVSFQYIVGGR